MSSLSVIVITKNEERNIQDCLQSVVWAGETIVVDGGSTDRTVELAESAGTKVHQRPWEGYGAAKNFAISRCSGTWVLWLDADERISKELAGEIQAIIGGDGNQYVGYEVARKTYFLGKWIRHCGWYPGYVVRLFRREAGEFSESRVHESLRLSGKIGRLRSDIIHYTDPNLFHYFEKFNRYTSLAAEGLLDEGQRFRVSQLIVRPLWAFIRMFILRRGFLDGVAGFILCVLSACYVFTKYAKLWELSFGKRRSECK